jgi:hypothetical protein
MDAEPADESRCAAFARHDFADGVGRSPPQVAVANRAIERRAIEAVIWGHARGELRPLAAGPEREWD